MPLLGVRHDLHLSEPGARSHAGALGKHICATSPVAIRRLVATVPLILNPSDVPAGARRLLGIAIRAQQPEVPRAVVVRVPALVVQCQLERLTVPDERLDMEPAVLFVASRWDSVLPPPRVVVAANLGARPRSKARTLGAFAVPSLWYS